MIKDVNNLKKRLFLIGLFCVLIISSCQGVFASVFPDLEENHWCYDTIVKYYQKGIIQGYEDGTFRPNNPITRAEYVKIVNQFFAYSSDNTQKSDFTDIPEYAWYLAYVNEAVSRGYIKGYEDGTFRPNAPIRRQEAVAILARILKMDERKDTIMVQDALSQYRDKTEIQDWAYSLMNQFAFEHLL